MILTYIETWLKMKGQVFKNLSNGQEITILFPGWFEGLFLSNFIAGEILFQGERKKGDILFNPTPQTREAILQQPKTASKNWILMVYTPEFFHAHSFKALESEVGEIFFSFSSFAGGENKNLKPSLVGKCGLLFPPLFPENILEENKANLRLKKLTQILKITAQNRLKRKAEEIKKNLTQENFDDLQEVLYQKIFQSFGLKPYQKPFEDLAKFYPYAQVMEALNQEHQEPKFLKIFAESLQALNIFNASTQTSKLPKNFLPPTIEKKIWELLPAEKLKISPPEKGKVHFLGSPERRLIGLWHHLEHTKKLGLLRSWLQIFQGIKSQSFGEEDFFFFPPPSFSQKQKEDERENLFSKKILPLFSPAFSNQEDWRNKITTGQDRVSILLVNAILPFFLVWGEISKDQTMEKKVFQFYWSLPGEKQNNAKVRLMEERLGKPNFSKNFKQSLAYSQSFIQLKDEFCLTFQQECKNCLIPRWLV